MSGKQMLAEALLDAEVKIGELLSSMSTRDDMGKFIEKIPDSITRNQSSQFQKMAERRAGELLREQEKNPGTVILGGDIVSPPKDIPKLSDIGISKKQYKSYIAQMET